MDIVINISMMIQVVINLANSGGPSPHTRERRQRRTVNVLGVRRRETFRRRQLSALSAQVLRGGAVVDQRPSVIPLPCPPNMMEEEVDRSSVECSSPIPLPYPPAMISNGDEEEVVRSSVETSSTVSTEEMNWEHGVSTPYSPSPVHQAGEWEQGVDTPHSPSPSAEEGMVNIKQEPITPAESPTPSSTNVEEEEEEGEGEGEGSPLKEEEVDTPVASPTPSSTEGESEEEDEEEMDAQAEGRTSLSDGCVAHIQTTRQVWSELSWAQSSSTTVDEGREGEEMEVGYTTPASTSSQPPLLPTPPPAPRRERSSHRCK
ncbi:unnamed protein product [Cyprideis torosa]|uniref:Uncharacterized protein n=1 Tax=Cyprideis torosa TaxID=163714 RepID=A0A7R8ZV74_9CRUS|nr:unnamed protein product [Cyprideis torosa]CAG0907118.1 unnamed protein product [Cyprideis torosa]